MGGWPVINFSLFFLGVSRAYVYIFFLIYTFFFKMV